jgi:hypothetical protein
MHIIASANNHIQAYKILQISNFQATDQNANTNMSASTTNNDITKTLALPPALRAMTATFNTAELLEQVLSYLPATQLLRSKATCRNFHNAITSSPTLRRKTSTYLLLNDVDEKDLFKTDAGGDVVYPIRDLQPLAFFYPGDGERRLFVRFSTTAEAIGVLRGSRGFAGLRIVDQGVESAVVGWHCGCFKEGRAEVGLELELEGGSGSGSVTFGDVLGAMERKHVSEGFKGCRSVSKFWLDGVWRRSMEVRQLGC